MHILDRFHIVAKMNDALDDVRAEEARALVRHGREPVLKKSRWCLLKRSENLTTPQKGRLKELLRYNLKSIRAYLLKEDFQQLWTYQSATWAGKWNMIAQAGNPHITDELRDAALTTCKNCSLFEDASPKMCRDCPAVELFKRISEVEYVKR